MKISVVVPVYNEEENVQELHARIASALERSPYDFEILFVDDGSRDRTLEILRGIASADPRSIVVQLRRNYGQTPSMRAGIDHASGEVIVTMDGDLQNDPEDIQALVDRLNEGFDLVAGWRRNRQDAWMSRKLPSKIANWLIGKVVGLPIRDNGCSLKAYRAAVIKPTPLYSEMHRFIPAMVSSGGGRIAEVPVRHHPRLRGTSKYGISRTGKVLLDMVTVKMLVAFADRPLHWFSLLAVPPALLALAALAVQVFWLSGSGGPGHAVLLSVAALLGYLSLHMAMLGFLGELVVRTGRSKPFRWFSRYGS
ncbi:MAG TPA: glycosyltransferase family 2 protein [Candidatus Eisenbacteria bacterium]|nr:glycosyltransferase family 2 protein [Candidatus Eisenbacteria bacterium]